MADNEDTVLPTSRKMAMALGVPRYFTGRLCQRGHMAPRISPSGVCVACDAGPERRAARAKRTERWRKRHPERAAQTVIEQRAKHIVKRRAEARQRAAEAQSKNPERVRKLRREAYRRKANKVNAAARARRKLYTAADRLAENLRQQRRYRADLEASRMRGRLRSLRERARRWKVTGSCSSKDVEWIFAEQGGKCAGFECSVVFQNDFEIDHRDPISRGGSNGPDNIALLCRNCNAQKQRRTMPEWFASMYGGSNA